MSSPVVRTILSRHAASSSSSKAFARESIGTMCCCFSRALWGAAPTLTVGESGAQSSGMLTSMSAADALLVVPPDGDVVDAGTVLRALPLDGDLGGSARFLA